MLGRRKSHGPGDSRVATHAVLVVNDDPAACDMLVHMVATAGHRTTGCSNPDDASARISAEHPDCVVLDLTNGGTGSSLKVLDSIRSHLDDGVRKTRVVLCASSPKNRSFSLESGADGFLVRPFHLSELLAQISDALARPDADRARFRRDELARHPD